MHHMFIMVGNIGCGKSTLTRKLWLRNTKSIVLSRDAIRYMIGSGTYVFDVGLEPKIKEIEMFMLMRMMATERNIIIDEVGISIGTRYHYLKLAKDYGYCSHAIILKDPGIREAVARRMKHDARNTPRKIWESVYKDFLRAWQTPTEKEGFKFIWKQEVLEAYMDDKKFRGFNV